MSDTPSRPMAAVSPYMQGPQWAAENSALQDYQGSLQNKDATAGSSPLPAPLASGDGGKIAEALAKAQGEIRNPGRGSENPHFKSKYTNLADGIAAIRGPLSKHGIAWVQITHVDGDFLMLTTSLIHAVSGETLDATWPVGAYAKLTPQQMGSSLTYGKRYSLFSLVGIAGDDDDDGNAASGKSRDEDGPLIDED